MNKPLVSICCITYNHEQFIAQALESFVMQQTNFDFEIVISNDCSKDSTQSIINSYKIQYPHLFKDISPKKNLGMMKNFKHTLESCTGKYIALCEGDDYWTDPLKLQKQVDFLETHTDYTLCAHRYQEFHEKDSKFKSIFVELFVESLPIEITINNFLEPYIIATHTVVYRNSNIYFPKQTPHFCDTFMFAIILSQGKGICLSDVMGVYRIHNKGVYSLTDDFFKLKHMADVSLSMYKFFKRKYSSIEDFAWNGQRSLLDYAYENKQKRLIFKQTVRLLYFFNHKYNRWQKKEILFKFFNYIIS